MHNYINSRISNIFTAEFAEHAEKFFSLAIFMTSAVSAHSAVKYNLKSVTIVANKNCGTTQILVNFSVLFNTIIKGLFATPAFYLKLDVGS